MTVPLVAGLAGLGSACSMTPPGGAKAAVSGARSGGGKGRPVIGVSAIDLTSSFFVGMRTAGDQAAHDYGVTATWQSAEGSVEKQVSTIQNFINQRVSAILIDPLDKNALRPVIARATRAGIPVVTMGNKVQADGNYSTLYRDADNMSMVARAIGADLGGHGEVALLVGARGNYVSDTREKAFRQTLAHDYPGVRLVSVQPTAFDARKASNTTVTWMTTHPKLDAVACISDPLCLAAKSTAVSLSRPGLRIAGHDGEPDMYPLLKNGSMVIDVLTGAERVGYWNVAVGARLAKKASLPHDLYLPSYFITTDATAARLKSRGLSFPYVTPPRAEQLGKDYKNEFGPRRPDSAMTVAKP
ncbi:sugar ABC transporter substrate-binding protein [Actinoallomurus sp. NBC_01490]|uniref:sugar ABC transporter substrate-binding protein n=1 Tax=Actinoallomurus sp. NBC_01490 TaxID=2903557 RepID=UPI002E3778D6|nr:sugar ABC transporter substrate-binding protein [Actinoallomurus sp. NBC_01490]